MGCESAPASNDAQTSGYARLVLPLAKERIHTGQMRKWLIPIVMALVLVSCGATEEWGYSHEAAVVGPPRDMCSTFIDRTTPLGFRQDPARYQEILSEAVRPVIDYALEHELVSDDNQELGFALERLYAGDAQEDDLWAVETLGHMLIEYGVPGCERVWRNLGPMAPHPAQTWEVPPAVEISSEYASGTADHACDVFIKTINIWEVDASYGAEYGPSMAEAVETLIHDLEAVDVFEATTSLQMVASLWATKPWVQANEEGAAPLIEAGGALVDVGSGRCADLFDAINPPYREPETPAAEPVTLTVDIEAVRTFDPGTACGHAVLPSMSAMPSTEPLDDDALQAMEAFRAAEEEGAGFSNTYRYEIFSRTDDQLILLGTSANGSFSDVAFDRVDGVWWPSGWGSCSWQPDGFHPVAWQLHPDYPPDPESDVIDLLAVDECGSVAERGHEVVVVAEDTGDMIAFEVWQSLYPPPGSGEQFNDLRCSIGGRLHLRVLLPDPIGSRTVEGEYADLNDFAD